LVLQYDMTCHLRRSARDAEAVEGAWMLLAPPTDREMQAGERRSWDNDVPFV
jgi:hypothetical protein